MKKTMIILMLGISFLLAAEDFKSYADTAELKQHWLEFDAGNPYPDTVELTAGKSMKLVSSKDYSVIYSVLKIDRSKPVNGLLFDLSIPAGSPANGFLVLQVRSEKNTSPLADVMVSLKDASKKVVPLAEPSIGQRDEICVVMMLFKTGNVPITVNKVEPAVFNQILLDDFTTYANTAELKKCWLEFDAENPYPEKMELVDNSMVCSSGRRKYSLVYRSFSMPPKGQLVALKIDFNGAVVPPGSGVLEFLLRDTPSSPDIYTRNMDLEEGENSVILNLFKFSQMKNLTLLITFQSFGQKLTAKINRISIISL